MRMRFDPHSGALYFRLREGAIEETLELPSPGAYVDVDDGGGVMGVEFLSLQEFAMFLTGFGGEVEAPEALDMETYDAITWRVAGEGGHAAEPLAEDLERFFREAFRSHIDRERARRP